MRKIITEINKIDKKIMQMINIGIIISFAISLIGIFFLITYNTYDVPYIFFEGGLILVKTGFNLAARNICKRICG